MEEFKTKEDWVGYKMPVEAEITRKWILYGGIQKRESSGERFNEIQELFNDEELTSSASRPDLFIDFTFVLSFFSFLVPL